MAEELEYIEIAPLEELPSGERLFLELDNQPVVVFNVGGKVYAIGDVCTHDGGPLGDGELDGLQVICPRHGARFDITTGKAMALPAVTPVPMYPARVVDGVIYIGLKK